MLYLLCLLYLAVCKCQKTAAKRRCSCCNALLMQYPIVMQSRRHTVRPKRWGGWHSVSV